MIRCRVTPIDRERPFSLSELFFSTTNEKGIILFGNDTFQRISGYEYSEIIGQPHNIIRHPHVPRCVFELFWKYLQSGKTIGAYVKNLAKDGSFYWVYALAMPCSDGFVSIRMKPSSSIFPIVRDAYAKVLAFEESIEDAPDGNRKDAIEKSLAMLVKVVGDLGYSSYDDFMHKALISEMRARIDAIHLSESKDGQKDGHAITGAFPCSAGLGENNLLTWSADLKGALTKLSDNVSGFSQLHEDLAQKSKYFLSLAQSINRLSLNAIVEANRLQDTGATLSVIAETLSRSSNECAGLMTGLNNILASLIEGLNSNLFAVTSANLKIEMIDSFFAEIMNHVTSGEQSNAHNSSEKLEHNISILVDVFSKEVKSVFPNLKRIHECLLQAQEQINKLQSLIMALHFVHFSGKVEASRSNDTKAFVIIFQEVNSQIDRASDELKDFDRMLQGHVSKFAGLAAIEKVIWDNLARISAPENIDAWVTECRKSAGQ